MSRNHTVQIVVAIIGLAGVLGAAVIANTDKIFPKLPPAGSPVTPSTRIGNGGGDSVGTNSANQTTPPMEACSLAGRVFDRNTNEPVAGVFIDFYSYQDSTRIRESRMLQAAAAITAPDGTFKAVCRGIPESEFPLRVAIGRRGNNQQARTSYMPVKVDFHDSRTDINLPAY